MIKLYKPLNAAAVVTHYAATGLAVAASAAIAGPWALGASALLIGGIAGFVIKKQKDFMEEGLVRHPDIHEHSPRLGEMVRELYHRSGLSSDTYPVYDFRADWRKAQSQGKGSEINRTLREVFNSMAQVPNAAAFNLGKPVIMISEPLLKLLDDEEEKAVLAHEFAHAAARHQHVAVPQRLMGATTNLANRVTLLISALGLGVTGVVALVAGRVGAAMATRALHPHGNLMEKDSDKIELRDMVNARKAKLVSNVARTAATAGILGFFSPPLLALYGGVKALAMGSKFLNSTLSRSMEYQADRGAVELGASPLALITSLRKITVLSQRSREAVLGADAPKPYAITRKWNEWHASHPTLERRIDRLSQLALQQGFTEAAINEAKTKTFDIPRDLNIPRSVIEQMMRRL